MSKQVLFYGVGEQLEFMWDYYMKLKGERELVGFIDRSTYKQGGFFLDKPIMSFEAAQKCYGDDFDIVVTANHMNAPNIIGFLLENNISSKRIINYEPVEKDFSCATLESELYLMYAGQNIEYDICCCVGGNSAVFMDRPSVIKPADKNFSGNEILSILDEKAKFAMTILDAENKYCHSCLIKKEAYYYTDKKLRKLNIGGTTSCNFNCRNCGNLIQWAQTSYDPWNRIVDDMKSIIASGVLPLDSVLILSLGEPSLAKNLDIFLDVIKDYHLILFSNAYVYRKCIAESMEQGHLWLRTSIDAGTRETFAKVKGVDGFKQVCQNLEEYSKHGVVILKYIWFRGLNDNYDDLNGFISFCDKIGAKADITNDFADKEELTMESLQMVADFIEHFQREGRLYGASFKPNERKIISEILAQRGMPNVMNWTNNFGG